MTVRVKRNASAALFACVSAIIVLMLVSASAFAQSDSTPTPKWDVFAGYQYLGPGGTVPLSTSDPSNPTPFKLPGEGKGIGSSVTYNFDPHWGGEVDFGYSRDSSTASSDWTASIGPRFMWRTDSVNLFAHTLFGLNRLSYDAGFATHNGIGIIAGGGMDVPITKMFSWRVFEADYVYSRHNFANLAGPDFPNLRRPTLDGARLRTGVVINWGGAPIVPPAASCSLQPTEVLVGEPITATVTVTNFNPKHTGLTYVWSGNGGTVTGKDTSAMIDTTNAAPGSYAVSLHVTDPLTKKMNEASCTANYTIKPLPPKNPPTISISADPTSLVPGGTVNLTANCTSPDGVPVSVANWTTTAGTISGTGTTATLNTAGLPPGPVTLNATCTDSRGLAGQASTQITVQNPPPPPVDKALEARLALHSVYFSTAHPTPKDPNGGLLPTQQKILLDLATDFKKYLEAKPDAHLTLGGHADHRGTVAFNQALTERRVASVKAFLVANGVPEADIDTKAFGKERNLTTDEVKDAVQQNPELTTEERKRALRNIVTIRMASNRRVDVTLHTAEGETEHSVRQFPFNSTDSLQLIGGREGEKKAAPKAAPKKKAPAKKQ
jgi:outer membrane protein OmpA-like peptidoglycan-associated protein